LAHQEFFDGYGLSRGIEEVSRLIRRNGILRCVVGRDDQATDLPPRLSMPLPAPSAKRDSPLRPERNSTTQVGDVFLSIPEQPLRSIGESSVPHSALAHESLPNKT